MCGIYSLLSVSRHINLVELIAFYENLWELFWIWKHFCSDRYLDNYTLNKFIRKVASFLVDVAKIQLGNLEIFVSK